jgi:outer membrane protein TolC
LFARVRKLPRRATAFDGSEMYVKSLSHHFACLRYGRRLAALVVAVLLIVVTGGCEAYQRRPLDLASLHTAFLDRTPQSPDVQSFAASLVAHERDSTAGRVRFDPVDGISLDEAELIALVFNADLRVARMRAGLTRATADNAGLWDDPTLGIDLARILESTPDPWKVFSSAGVTIPISGRLRIERHIADAAHVAQLARVAQQEWSVRMAVRRAWCEWTALEAQLTAARDFLIRVDQILAVVEMMESAGEIARTEARLFRIERATQESELASLESQLLEADLRLRQLMGLSPDASLQFQSFGFERALDASHPQAIFDTTELEHRSPALLVAAAEYEAAEHTLQLEIRKQYPDLHLAPGFGREDGMDQVLLGLSIPIPILNANRQRIAEAKAQRDLAQATAQAALEQTIAAVRLASVRLAAAAQRRTRFETNIVPMVDAQYADAREVARLGEVNTLVLLESLTRQQEAKFRFVEAARDEAIAAIDLDEIFGPTPTNPPSVSTATTNGQ